MELFTLSAGLMMKLWCHVGLCGAHFSVADRADAWSSGWSAVFFRLKLSGPRTYRRSLRTAGRTGRTSDVAIRGHVFCSFLALVLQKELVERCRAVGFTSG